MADTSKGMDVQLAESGTRDGSDLLCTVSQASSSNVARRRPAEDNVSQAFTPSSSHTMSLLGNASDDAAEFNPNLPTDYGLAEQAQPGKSEVVEALLNSDKDGSEEMKSSPRKEDSPECPDGDDA